MGLAGMHLNKCDTQWKHLCDCVKGIVYMSG